MNRGDVYEVRLDPTEGSEQSGTRPAVIVSRDSLNTVLNTVVIVPLTSLKEGRRPFANQALVLEPAGGLTADSVALCEQIRTVSKTRLLRKRGEFAPDVMQEIESAIAITMGFG